MQGLVKGMKRRLVQAVALAIAAFALGASPAQAVLDEGGASGGAQSSPSAQASAGGFDWGDAGVGIAIGVGAGALAVGTALALRRPREGSEEPARPGSEEPARPVVQ